jgi:opacity protein-like surface antigen
MRKTLIFICLTAVTGYSSAQDVYLNIFAGAANYQGDLQSKRFTVNQAGAALGASLVYEFSSHITLRGGFTFGKIKASDAKSESAAQIKRNLSFESTVLEGHIAGEYHFLNIYQRNISPYIFGGLAFYRFNPYTYTQNGRKVFLQPLSTEGQGLQAYPDRKTYKLTQFSLPFGGGLRLAVSDNIRLGFELGFRKTFTDYLDDVSDKYADQTKLLNERGQEAVDLAYRGDELPGGLGYPTENEVRGSAKSKDWYYFAGLNIGIRLLGEGESYNPNSASKRYRTGCPKNVY